MTPTMEHSTDQESWPGIDLAALEAAGFRYEIVSGALHVVPPNNDWHQQVSPYTWQVLRRAAPPGWLIRQERGVLCGDERRIPDVVVFLPGAPTDLDWTPARHVALVVEVESPSTRREDRGPKLDSYAEAGIPVYWRIERGSDGPIVHVYELGDGQRAYAEIATVKPGDTFTARRPFPVALAPATLLD